jgi:nucleotide-binding universal stress UspA family protein
MSIFPTMIFLATDGSTDAELTVITTVGLAGRLERVQASQQAAKQVLDRQVERIERLGGTVAQAHLKTGTVGQEIVKLAEELAIDLIAVGSRGRGTLKRALMGGVSYSVVRHAHCPVMVVRSEQERSPEH